MPGLPALEVEGRDPALLQGPVWELNVSGTVVQALGPALLQFPGSYLYRIFSAESAISAAAPDVRPATHQAQLPRDSLGRAFLPFDPTCVSALVGLLHMRYTMGGTALEAAIHYAVPAAMAAAAATTCGGKGGGGGGGGQPLDLREGSSLVWRWETTLSLLGPFPASWGPALVVGRTAPRHSSALCDEIGRSRGDELGSLAVPDASRGGSQRHGVTAHRGSTVPGEASQWRGGMAHEGDHERHSGLVHEGGGVGGLQATGRGMGNMYDIMQNLSGQ